MRKKILLLGSGELGKELVIALQRLGQYVIAVDSYAGAPAMQVAHEFEVINMLDAASLDTVVEKHNPDLVVPEIEAIRTECFFEYEKKGIQVVPSAKAANYTMNRKLIRDLAAKELGIRTARYLYATEFEQFKSAVLAIGIPCIVKPLMSSSGKGQSVVKTESDIERSWQYALEGSRGDVKEVIIEEFIHFQSEITLLTVTQKNGDTLFCAPIGHRQERGDYQESWQPAAVKDSDLKDAQDMAEKVTEALGGSGIWGVEFFLSEKGVYFSELSPRPHDTGMVTLAGTQNLNEFELHARAILGLPIPQIELLKNGVSAVILSSQSAENYPVFSGVEEALAEPKSDLKLFGKPTTRKYRRMGVSLVYDDIGTDMKQLRDKAFKLVSKVVVN
jgi:phosphoribosylglycinamide formyltransferase 2